jgi:hypothetical protein
MQAQVHWIDGHENSLKSLILSHALPLARQGLEKLGINDLARWLDIIEARVVSEQTGANWILWHWKQHGDTSRLVQTYLQHANTNTPVHLWPAP